VRRAAKRKTLYVPACYSPVSSTPTTADDDGPGWSAVTTAFLDHRPAADR
jgi:hypothetical protein